MKAKKGTAGYISARKRQALLKTILEFGMVAALLILGIVETGDRMNLLTVVAVLGCLPASKALVEWIMILPHRTVARQIVADMEEKAGNAVSIYDLVFTAEKQIMPVDCMLLAEGKAWGYTSNFKADASSIEAHIKQYLAANKFTGISVKLFKDYGAFLQETVNCAQEETDKRYDGIRQVILNISL